MNFKIFRYTAYLGVLLLSSCSSSTQEGATTESKTQSTQLDFEALAELILERMDLQTGETVLLVAEPGRFDPLIASLESRIVDSPGEYLGTISIQYPQPEKWFTSFVKGSQELDDDKLREYLKQVDIGIMLPGATPEDKVYGLMQDNLDEGVGRTIHFHWAGAFDLNGQEMDINPEIDLFYQEVLLTTDYRALATDQKSFEDAIRDRIVRVTTPEGTDISFEIGDRPVTKQSGDASAATASSARNLIDLEMELPSGAIRVAPIESSVNGKIKFPDSFWGDSVMVKGLVLTFENGTVIDMIAESGIDAVQQVMNDAGESARSFREFALGMNPKLAIPEENPWIPYYGYGSGVVRLSLGDNTELGGNVTGGFVRWNFFTDATVQVGGEVWVKDGILLR